MPPRLTKDYLRKRLWLAKLAIAVSLLISVAIGWTTLSSLELHGAYARVLTDLTQGIDNFESDLAWTSSRDQQAEPRKLLKIAFRDVVELVAFIRMNDGDIHDEVDLQWNFIKSDLQVDPQVLNNRYAVSGRPMPAKIREIWYPHDASKTSLEAAVGRFVTLGYRLVQTNDATSPEYQTTLNALRMLMKSDLRPTFRVILDSLAERTTDTARLGLYMLVLCALAGILAAIVNGFVIFRPMLHSVIASHDALTLERDRALASARAKREFLSMMSHELRTPLNGVLGFANLLLSTPLATKQKDYAETIQTAGLTLLDLLNDILDITHIEAGSIELEKSNFSPEAVMSEVLALLGPQAFAKRLDLGAYIDPSLPEKMAGDAGRVRQVLLKLVGNAIKFTESGGVAIEIRPGNGRDDGKINVNLAVSDSGIGIPKNQLSEIFEHFTQVDASSSRQYGGAGLGLPICKRLVTLMRGDMGVDSVLGKGSTFWVKLPLDLAVPPAEKILDASNMDLSGKRVIVVDDNALNRNIFRLQLEGFKAEVECAADGRSALRMLVDGERSGRPFDIAIIDHMMPEMDGITLRKLIREQPQYDGLKLIISSSGGIAFDQQARALGFDAACPKPVIQEKLIRTIRELLNQPVRRRTADASGHLAAPALAVVEEPAKLARLLVAEDNPINQRLIVTALTEVGYVVDAVADGVEAVHAMQRLPYDLILMDIRMPVMSGVDATRRIRSMQPPAGKVPIIAMTANTLPGDREEYLAAGMNEYVPKPIDFEDLLSKIRSYIDGSTPELTRPEPEAKLRALARKRPA